MFSNLLYKFLTIIATIKVLVIPCFITKYTLNITPGATLGRGALVQRSKLGCPAFGMLWDGMVEAAW